MEDAAGGTVADYLTSLSAPLQPGEQTFVTWVHVVQAPGDYLIEFSTWRDATLTADSLLDRDPVPPAHFIAGQEPGQLQVGQSVVTTVDLDVRQGPGQHFPEITDAGYGGDAPAGTSGTVIDGPVESAGVTWWRVQYAPGYAGWSVESGLRGV